jgi:hypothetical protein
MAFTVKSKNPDGSVSAATFGEFKAAMRLRDDLNSKRITAWLEDQNGQRIGFTKLSDDATSQR